ncbi:NUDIX hydrolase [Lacticaseibacillus saniviri]
MDQLAFIRRILAISQAGLAYATDKFDIERYQDLQQLAMTQMSAMGDEPFERIVDLFTNEHGYPTPKVDVRAFIQKGNQVLLVENTHGHWALPGGFAEIGWTLKQNVIKEVQEETGLSVHVQALRAICDTSLGQDIPQPVQYYKAIFSCSIDTGEFVENSETVAMRWFDRNALPVLSRKRTTEAQLRQLFEPNQVHID